MAPHDIGIVIVNYNVRHFLVQCLHSVLNSQTAGLNVEVWVVDNASVDGSVALLQKDFPSVRLIANKKNVGFSAANNQAIVQMNARYILLLNPDTLLEEDTLQKCYEFMESHPDAGALGVRMIDGAGKFLPESKRKVPDLWNSFCKLTYLSEIFPTSKIFSGYNLGYLPENESNEVDVLCGAFMFMSTAALEKTGLLDEAFFMYGEDIDLSYRILQSGYKIWYYPETSIIHYKGESTKKSSINYVRTFYGAMHIYVNKHYGKGNAAIFARIIGLAISARALISGLGRIINNWIRPLIDGILIWWMLSQIKYFWAEFYFKDIYYYQNTSIDQVLMVYTLIWLFFLWLGGHYARQRKWWTTIFAIGTGTIFILMGYALLPEYMRTSRAIILIGTGFSAFIASITALIAHVVGRKSSRLLSEKNVAIVAYKDNAVKLLDIMKKSNIEEGQVHYIFPGTTTSDTWYSNTLDALPKVVSTLKINEVIYSSEDLTMKEIIKSMTHLESRVSFKIGGDDSLSIIGSNNKNQPGELYALDVNYNLSSELAVRFKRIFDIIFTLVIMPLLPVLWVLNAFNLHIFYNIFYVLIGKATWVGYGGEFADYSFLPAIKKAVVRFPLSEKMLVYTEDHFKRMNMAYAKEYNVWMDLKVLIKNIFKLGNQI